MTGGGIAVTGCPVLERANWWGFKIHANPLLQVISSIVAS